jgi:L-fucose isomerase-like protein
MAIKKAIDYKLKVKPAYMQLIHTSAYEGPCRLGKGEQLTTEFDTKIGYQKFKTFKETLDKTYDKSYVEFMDPELITWTDEFILREAQMEKLTSAVGKADLFLFDGVFHQFPAMEISENFKVPVGVIGCCASTDGVAGLRNMDLEAYGYIDPTDANRQFKFMQVKQAMRNTRVLVILKNDIVSKGVLSTVTNLQKVTRDLGVKFTFINAEDLFQAMDAYTPEQAKEAEDLAKDLNDNATDTNMSVENLTKSTKFYVVIKSLLEKYECNAFTMPCFEVCATRKFNDEYQCTPCLTHTLLKEQGIPSACESDINALLAMTVIMYLTRKAPHMGNTHPFANEVKTDESTPSGLELIPEIEGKKNIVSTWHAVQTRKMNGIDGPYDKYSLKSFTLSGWGATVRHDFSGDVGKEITLVRFHPNGKKMLAAKGTIVAGAGENTIGCSTGIYYTVKDSKDLFKKMLDFGHHYTWVYGDYIENLKELGDALNLEIVTA